MIRGATSVTLALATSFVATPARALDADARRIEIGASLGYDLPVGSAERGARLGDATFGVAPIQIDGAYRFTDRIGVAIAASYGLGAPTLCASTGDCIASLGRDVALSIRARLFFPRLGPVAPRVDAGIGYEWWTTRLVDKGATSTRSYDGPMAFVVEVAAPFAVGSRASVGPVLGGSIGAFTGYHLASGPVDTHGSVPALALHAWLSLALRVGVSF
jgi:hypothetical protein